MKKFAKKLSALTLCTLFATMQIASATIDTGLNNAVINNYTGGFDGNVIKDNNSATLNFTNDAHINWNTLNVGKGETLNFNANPGAGVTVLNTVNSGMTTVYGTISANEGISKLIISNPNGMLYDGAQFTTTGALDLTTQAVTANFANGKIDIQGLKQEALQGIKIYNNSKFTVGGEFNITAPAIEAISSVITTKGGAFKLTTADGQNFLVSPNTSKDTKHCAVKLKTVSVNGDVYITTAEDAINIVEGGTYNGNINIKSQGNVYMNLNNGGKKLTVTGDINSENAGRNAYLRQANVGGNVNMTNKEGIVEIGTIKTGGNVNLKTTNPNYEHNNKNYIHVVGTNEIGGDLNVDSIHNVHIGGYDKPLNKLLDGKNTVGGNLNAVSRNGSIAVTVDTSAKSMDLTSEKLDIITNGKAVLKADEYNFKANGYIGGLDSDAKVISVMENYTHLNPATKQFVNIEGGKVNKIDAGINGYAFLRANNSMTVNNVSAKTVNLSAGKDITIGKDTYAQRVVVDGETDNLTVELKDRPYSLEYTNIRDGKVIKIAGNEEITAEMANGKTGLNVNANGRPDKTTYLVAPMPEEPTPPVEPDVPPVEPDVPPVNPDEPATPPTTPDDNGENMRVLKNFNKDQTASAIDAGQIYTPVAFAADLDDEDENGVRKNVDGSVTVVRPFTPTK